MTGGGRSEPEITHDLSIHRSTGRSSLNTCIHFMKSITEPGKSVVSNDLIKKMNAERGPGQTGPQGEGAQDSRGTWPQGLG